MFVIDSELRFNILFAGKILALVIIIRGSAYLFGLKASIPLLDPVLFYIIDLLERVFHYLGNMLSLSWGAFG